MSNTYNNYKILNLILLIYWVIFKQDVLASPVTATVSSLLGLY